MGKHSKKKHGDRGATLVVAGIFLFLVTMLFLAPVVHEWFHLVVLDAVDCYEIMHEYYFNGVYGFHGVIEFECPRNNPLVYGLVYGAGYLGTLLLGFYILSACLLLLLVSRDEVAVVLSPVGTGFVLSSCTGFMQQGGELSVALAYIGLGYQVGFLPVVGFSLFLACLAYLWIELRIAFTDLG